MPNMGILAIALLITFNLLVPRIDIPYFRVIRIIKYLNVIEKIQNIIGYILFGLEILRDRTALLLPIKE